MSKNNTVGKFANDDDNGDGDFDNDDYRLPVIRTRRSTDALN